MENEENKKEELNKVSEEKEKKIEAEEITEVQEEAKEIKEDVEKAELSKKEEEKKEEVKEAEVVPNNEQTKKETPKESKGLAIAAMVLGIISLVFWCVWYISIPCAILAIVFGAVARKKAGKGMAIAGLVLGIITACLLTLTIIFGVTIFSSIISSPELWEDIIDSSYNYSYDYDYDL